MAVIIIIFISIITIQLIEDRLHTRSYNDLPDTSIVSEEKAKLQIKQNLFLYLGRRYNWTKIKNIEVTQLKVSMLNLGHEPTEM